jgi:hypothetical protein
MGTLPRIYIEIYAREFEGAYFDLILNVGPYLFHGQPIKGQQNLLGAYFDRTKGVGIKIKAIKPNNVEAHCGPSLSYI